MDEMMPIIKRASVRFAFHGHPFDLYPLIMCRNATEWRGHPRGTLLATGAPWRNGHGSVWMEQMPEGEHIAYDLDTGEAHEVPLYNYIDFHQFNIGGEIVPFNTSERPTMAEVEWQ